MRRTKVAIAVLMTGAMTAFGLGCAAPPGVSQEQHNQWIGNGVFAVLYMAMCQANFGKCPFPLGPSDPAPAP